MGVILAQAVFDFERALRLQPGSALHHYDYALALARANRFDDAQHHVETALRADDTLPEAHELLGGLFERLVLSRLKANPLGQVLVTLGMSFIISDACLLFWGGDSIPVPTPQNLQAPTRLFGFVFPTYRLVLVGCAIVAMTK